MIAVFYGKDDFSAHEALDELKRELDSDPSPEGLADNAVQVDGASARPDELLALCQTVPFLSARRLVIVRGLLGQFEGAGRRGRRRSSEAVLGPWEAFVEGLPTLPESTVLVFLDGKLDPKNPLLQALSFLKEGLAQVREFKPLPQAGLAGWINRRAQRYGVSLEARAVAALAGLVGNHLWTLDSELQKLAAYADGRPVAEEDVRSLVSLARDPSVFAMADAVIEGRPRDAAELLQRLLADGKSPQYLLTMVARQYRLLLLTKELLQRGARPPEISARLQVQGFVIQRLLQQAPSYTIDRLRGAYRRLLEADLSVKRGVFDDETALQLLLFELAAAAGPRQRA
ncbi:MAG: DNA polymerase III subunit delta [Chloroflexi bacterium RBG_16_68_14]|nr:MAG: DNA polymerase III subunit delta [Chloroflexi bacterium RBG_16_68_14]